MLPESGWHLSPYFPHCPQLIPETYSFQPLKVSEGHPSSPPFMLGLHLGHLHALTGPAGHLLAGVLAHSTDPSLQAHPSLS